MTDTCLTCSLNLCGWSFCNLYRLFFFHFFFLISNQNPLLSSSSLFLVILFEVDTHSNFFAATNHLHTDLLLLILTFRLNHLNYWNYHFYIDHIFWVDQPLVPYLKSYIMQWKTTAWKIRWKCSVLELAICLSDMQWDT